MQNSSVYRALLYNSKAFWLMAKNINLEKYWWLFKTKKAVVFFKEEYKDTYDTRIGIFREYIPKAAANTWKKVWKISRKDLADRVFSEYVRLFYADDRWYVRCFTSWVRLFRTDAQCWHYRSRDYLKYRFDIRNCHPQSQLDNVTLKWNYRNYHKNMVAEYGEEVEEQLRNDKELVDYNQARYEANILNRYAFIQEKKANLIT